MNRVQQPRTLLVLALNAGMSTAAGADELVRHLTPRPPWVESLDDHSGVLQQAWRDGDGFPGTGAQVLVLVGKGEQRSGVRDQGSGCSIQSVGGFLAATLRD